MKQKIYIIGSTAHSIINFRYDLINCLRKTFKISALSQDYNKFTYNKLKKINVEYHSYGLNKFKFLNEIISFLNLSKFLLKKKKIKVLSYTLRANFFGGIYSLFNKNIKHYPMITGLGGIFLSKNENLLRYCVFFLFKILFKISLMRVKAIIYQNLDDKKYFKKNIINKKYIIVPGSGVNLRRFKQKRFPKKLTFMMISRIIKNKGIENFFLASKIITKFHRNVEFIFVGKEQKNFSLSKNYVKNNTKLSNIKFLKWKKNVNDFYRKCSVYILPSKREGMSRTILEAMSCGRPIITSNVPGCKQTVKNDYNGYLIKYNNNNNLLLAIKKFISQPRIVKQFGINSRKRAVKYFDVKITNRKILELIKK